MNFEYQLNSTDCEEAYLANLNGSSESERRTFYKWVLLIGIFFLLIGMLLQENGFLGVGVVLMSPSILSIFGQLFVKKGVEEIYEIYDVESDIGVDREREMPSIANSANCGQPMTVEVIGEGLVLNTTAWARDF
jgi:hypothetical protein